MPSAHKMGSAVVTAITLLSCSRPAPTTTPVTAAARVDAMRAAVARRPELQRVNAEEDLYGRVRREVLEPWRRDWLAGRAGAYARVVDRAAGVNWASAERALRRDVQGIKEYDWRLGSAESAESEAQRYLSAFTAVDDFCLDVHRMVPAAGGSELEVAFDLRGRVAAGRRHDRGRLTLRVSPHGAGWRITSLRPSSMESLEAAREPTFQAATTGSGLDAVPVTHRSEAIRRGGYALAVADFDDDQRPDVLVGNEGPVQLFHNEGGRFVEVSRAAGLHGETRVKSAVFADLDNDGRRDLALLRFIDRSSTDDDLSIYRNVGGGRFERVEGALPRARRYDRGMPLAVADFDGDGRMDLYLGFPGARDFTNNLARAERPEGLLSQGLWLNQGGWRFREMAAESGLGRDRDVYPHATLVADFNQDGRADLMVVDDSGRVSPVYRNDGAGHFRNVTQESGIQASGWSMAAAAGDFDGDGDTDVVTTHVDLLDGIRMAASAAGREQDRGVADRLATLQRELRGSLLFRNRGDGSFEEVSTQAGLGWVGEGAAGAEWVDYNSDGQLDLYVANGLWSGGDEEFSSLFLRAALLPNEPGSFEALDEVTGGSVFAPRRGEPNPMLTILREYRGQLASARGPLAASPTLSMAGHQRNRLFRNNGDGSFTEVGYLEGADRVEDGYVVATADYDSDGRQDLVLRHCDPAPGQRFESVTLLHNVGANGRSIRIDARNATSHVDGFGATVTAWVGGRRLVREIRAVSGAVQSEPVAFIGVGAAERVDRVEVRWPSGATQVVEGVNPGRIVLRQPTEGPRVAAR